MTELVSFLSQSSSLTLACQLKVAPHGFMFPSVLNESEENYNGNPKHKIHL